MKKYLFVAQLPTDVNVRFISSLAWANSSGKIFNNFNTCDNW